MIRVCLRLLPLLLSAVVLTGCFGARFGKGTEGPGPVTRNATAETRALFHNLDTIRRQGFLFGHADDLAYGHTWRGEPGRSDVKESSGSYPAVYGWDVATLFRTRGPGAGREAVDQLRNYIIEGYNRGGVITFAWHARNPVTGGSFYDTTRAVAAIIPGGSHHEQFKASLDTIATFFNSLRAPGRDGGGDELIPVIFRPYHEHTGSWFWWGRRHATIDEFRTLWQFTVTYLRDVKGVRNVLYAYSTDVFNSEAEYLERYPGDEYIDMLGFDDYQSIRTNETRATLAQRLRTVVTLAEARGKLPAMTETGVESIPDANWFTGTLLPGILSDPIGRRIAYVLVWRNANRAENPKHHYAPFEGHPAAPDFRRFKEAPEVFFEDELPDLYRLP